MDEDEPVGGAERQRTVDGGAGYPDGQRLPRGSRGDCREEGESPVGEEFSQEGCRDRNGPSRLEDGKGDEKSAGEPGEPRDYRLTSGSRT